MKKVRKKSSKKISCISEDSLIKNKRFFIFPLELSFKGFLTASNMLA